MADKENIKQNRTKAKQAVTLAARRLTSSVNLNCEIHILSNLMSELDKAYCEFTLIDEDFEHIVSQEDITKQVVNGKKKYRQTVSNTYQQARDEFSKRKQNLKQAIDNNKAIPIRQALNRCVREINKLITQIDSDVTNQYPDIETLTQDINELEKFIESAYNQLSELQVILGCEQTQDEQNQVDLLADNVSNKKREVNALKRKQPSDISSSSVHFTTTEQTKAYNMNTSVDVTQSNFVSANEFPNTQRLGTNYWSRNPNEGPIMNTGYFPGHYSSSPITAIPPRGIAPTNLHWSTGNYQLPQQEPFEGQRQFPNSSHVTGNFSDLKFQRVNLPTFSGKRVDWPEFKAVWRDLAVRYENKTALAHELKRSVHGEAAKRIKSVYATKPEAYDIMWRKLEDYYDDVSACVQAALEGLQKLKLVKDDDYQGLVELIEEIEVSYSQLEELGQLDTLTMRDVDHITTLLPNHVRFEWIRKFQDLPSMDKIKPFVAFMSFLERERQAVARLAETQISRKTTFKDKNQRSSYAHNIQSSENKTKLPRKTYFPCAFPDHRRNGIQHVTKDCYQFKKLPIQGKGGKYELLKQINACFLCFGDHRREDCSNKSPCSNCGKSDHHSLLCKDSKPEKQNSSVNHMKTLAVSHNCDTSSLAIYPIQQVNVPGTGQSVSVFCDGGSNTTYITHKAADRIQAKKLNSFSLDVTTMGNVQKTYNTRQYQVTLQTQSGQRVTFPAYGMDKITGPVSKLDTNVLAEIFPDYDVDLLQRQSHTVDILLGCDNFGLHPKYELSKAGENLSIMQGAFGVCLQGAHPKLKEETKLDTNLAKTLHETHNKIQTFHSSSISHVEFDIPTICKQSESGSVCLVINKQSEEKIYKFIMGDELVTETTPRYGNCRCGKCPTVGHTYSFREEQELNMIRENLRYDPEKRAWCTTYPWLIDPKTLPDNYSMALSTLRNTEHTLNKDLDWAAKYESQIQDMLDRNVARKLSAAELREWTGPKFYISHLAVVNTRSQSTPVRIVFNSSQPFKGVSLNSCLAKGPDCYLNNLIGLLLRWREQQVAVVGDIKKMFNSVYLDMTDQHCHRFLWRNLDPEKPPDVYVIQRVNMGDTPAPAIACEAIYKTAEMFKSDSPRAANLLKHSSYVDDLIDSFPSISEAECVTNDSEIILNKGGFKVKCWQFSGEQFTRVNNTPSVNDASTKSLLKGDSENLRVLGLGWKPETDLMVFQVVLNFSRKRKGIRTEPDLTKADLPKAIPLILTKRMVLEQVMTIYDPLGLVCPFTLLGKVYLRETWERKYDWDDQLSDDLRNKWVTFFTNMFEMEQLKLPRCLKPQDTVSSPWLIIMSDGSDIAYGFAAYILWKLKDGSHWCRLIMAKCRIAPLKKLSTPQMELNAAVLSKRARKVIEKEMRFQFERVLHLVDSETVLNMLNRTSTRFKVYEGVRIGEIQAATNGDMTSWAWISGDHNVADWTTRAHTPKLLGGHTIWFNDPPILTRPVEDWNLKFGTQREIPLPGEMSLIDYQRFSSVDRLIWVVARLRNIAIQRSFKGGSSQHITPQNLREAEDFIVKDAQIDLEKDLLHDKGRYARLAPYRMANGIWAVGQRLQRYNAMSMGSGPQKLLPTNHACTRLFMQRAHNNGHRGRDATLANFRQHFWVPHGDKLAKSVKSKCTLCKLREPKLMQQHMGLLPEFRLKPSTPFNHVMLDLFGPYSVRGEIQKRTSGKAYGVICTDLAMRAVHIEGVFGYDTDSFLMALSRFASVRGWPELIFSDPGTQLIGAEKELKQQWEKVEKDKLKRKGAEAGLQWIFGPADSSWHQGAVESLVKSAKRAINFAIHNQRLSASEFLTICAEISNLLNERPIGTKPSVDSEVNVLTPNCLLLGRATAKNPAGWQPYTSVRSRYHLVQSITDNFWKRWIELYAPSLVIRPKWATSQRNLEPGDVVIVADKNVLRGSYHLGLIKETFPGQDGKAYRCH